MADATWTAMHGNRDGAAPVLECRLTPDVTLKLARDGGTDEMVLMVAARIGTEVQYRYFRRKDRARQPFEAFVPWAEDAALNCLRAFAVPILLAMEKLDPADKTQ